MDDDPRPYATLTTRGSRALFCSPLCASAWITTTPQPYVTRAEVPEHVCCHCHFCGTLIVQPAACLLHNTWCPEWAGDRTWAARRAAEVLLARLRTVRLPDRLAEELVEVLEVAGADGPFQDPNDLAAAAWARWDGHTEG